MNFESRSVFLLIVLRECRNVKSDFFLTENKTAFSLYINVVVNASVTKFNLNNIEC